MPQSLTAVQGRVLEAIRRRTDRGEPAPTYRELCEEFGWASTASARDHLRALARKGHLDPLGTRVHRQVRLRDGGAGVARVPLVGRVVAGVPVRSEEAAEGRLPVPLEWVGGGTCFAVRVVGDSMQDAGIFEDDYVIVRQRERANDGDIVVTTLDGETTLKRLRLRAGRMTLVAENRSYRPIDVRTESMTIHGVVVGLLRSYRKAKIRMRGAAPRTGRREGSAHAHGS